MLKAFYPKNIEKKSLVIDGIFGHLTNHYEKINVKKWLVFMLKRYW